MADDGYAVHYTVLRTGVPVYSSDEVEVGRLESVADNPREHIFDGIVITTPSGEVRFVDAPEVARTAERAVTLNITAAAAAELPAPDPGAPTFRANPRAGRVGRLLGGGWRRR